MHKKEIIFFVSFFFIPLFFLRSFHMIELTIGPNVG